MYSLLGKIGKKGTILLLLMTVIVLCAFVGVLCYSAEASNHVVINEVCSNNFSVATDENGNYSDYVELYNPASVPVSLTGFSLSDSEIELQKCLLDTVIIPAGGYYIVWVDGSDGSSVGHAEFKLSKTGENVYFSNNKGQVIDAVDVPELEYDTVYARKEEAVGSWVRQRPSQGASNNNAEQILKVEGEGPVFSTQSGFYEDSFELSMTAETDEVIYYTLDGSNPTTESLRYNKPILISDAGANENVYSARNDLMVLMEYIPDFKVDKATVVRAVTYNEKENTISETVTGTYFVDFEEKEEYDGYPVLSLVTDPDNLFDANRGIYGNGKKVAEMTAAGEKPSYLDSNAMNRGKEWEREAVIQYFDAEHESTFEQAVGIRISGESTRSAAQKSFNVYARDIYDGNTVLKYDFFENMSYSSIKLRNGGTAHSESKIMDAFLQHLSAERNVSVQASEPCVVFLNGEYWGIYNIRERYKEDYFKNHYGINGNNIWMIDAGAMSIGSYDAWNAYDEMIKFISENDMTIPENYEKAGELIDIQSLIDFYCINLYIDNTDMAFDKNMGVWRSVQTGEQEFEDCKWRFMLYDLDGAMDAVENNTFVNSEWWKEDFNLMDEPIIKSLMKNKDFKERFYETFLEIAETTFAYEKVHEELMEWQEIYEIQAVKSHQRFISADSTAEEYEGYIGKMDDFFKRRYDYIIGYLEEEMGINQE